MRIEPIKHITPKNDWVQILDSSNNTCLNWVPIFEIAFDINYSRVFGITSDGFWMNLIVIGESKKVSIQHSHDVFLNLITVLQKERKDIEALLENGLEEQLKGRHNLNLFPFKLIMAYAIERGSGFWAKRAVHWLKQEDFNQDFCRITKHIIQEKRLDQQSRHKLFRLMKRYERSRSES